VTHTNPLRDPRDRRLPRIAGPCGMVLFGVTGDLSRKKIMPAIYDLANRGLLPPGFSLVGFARRDWADQDFAQIVHDSVKAHARTEFREEVWKQLAEGFRFVSGDFDDDHAFEHLRRTIDELDELRGTRGNHAFYLAIPPGFFGNVVGQLKEHDLAVGRGDSWRRVVIEKPFGHDLRSARELQAVLGDVFPSGSIFRIDHYLGKETVQNILAMRFANEMFEPIWNANYVDHVQITMAEDIGIGGRAGYYDGIGAARDVIQNHLLQLLALTAMEEPTSFDADSLRIEKQKVLSSITLPRRLDLTTARGQYAEGWAGGEKVIGFLEEEGIKRTSTTETFAAVKLNVETRRWGGVPFYLRTGKRLGRRVTEVAVVFKRAPAVRRRRHRGARPERPGDPHPARRGRHPPVRLEGAGHRDGDPRRQHGLRVRRRVHRVLPGGVRATDPRRPPRRPAAVPPARGGRAVLEDPGPDPRALGQAGCVREVQGRAVRVRQVGTPLLRRDARP
jgi:glucose-6-phosphate 1-dehydrogenase